jgi:hypothetical protein
LTNVRNFLFFYICLLKFHIVTRPHNNHIEKQKIEITNKVVKIKFKNFESKSNKLNLLSG